MPVNLASPGISVREVDLTLGRVDPASAKIGGLVAPFAQGPVDVPILIGSEKDLLDNFGKPYSNDNHYEHWLSVSSYLAYGSQMRVVRVDDDNLYNAVSAGSSIKIKSIEDYEIKLYDENIIPGRTVVAKNPGSWANGIRVGVIDSKADQILSVGSTSGISIGNGIEQSVSLFTEDNVIVSPGQTTTITGKLKGIVTEVGEGTVGVKFVSHIDSDDIETPQDYTYGGVFRFRKDINVTFVGAGAGSTSANIGRNVLGETAGIVTTGAAVNSYYLEKELTLDMQGGVSLTSNSSSIGISTADITVGAGKFLAIGNELISLASASIGSGVITGVNRGQVGTVAATHADGSPVKHLTQYTGIATVTSEINSTSTNVGLTTDSLLDTKVNAGGFLELGLELVSVTSLLDGSSVVQTPTEVVDWFDQQKLDVSKEVVGGTIVTRSINWNIIAERPGTSEYATERGSRFDEVHVVVIDGDGKITGNAGTILERHLNLSKAKDATFSVGSPSYWRTYLKNNSAYIFGGSAPSNLSPSGFLTGYETFNDNGWDQNAEDSANGPILFGGGGNNNLTLSGGTNYDGLTAIDSNNSLRADLSKIISGYNLLSNKEQYQIDFILMGSANYEKNAAASLASQIISIAEQRKDALAFISPYRGAFLSESGNGSTNSINNDDTITENVLSYYNSIPSSSFAVFDSGYKYMYDRFANTFRYIPLNGDIAGLCARNDIDNFPWFSPAGTSRGAILNAVKLAYNPNQSQRDRLYSARINPVIFSPGAGIILFGDKTGLTKASAFDRINVRRLFIYLEDAISSAAKDQLFEFNDEITRTNFVNIVEPFLRDVQAKRGIQDYVVICDETNNTAAVIDNNEFVADIYIKPSRSINFIGLTFVATRTGVSFEEVIGNV